MSILMMSSSLLSSSSKHSISIVLYDIEPHYALNTIGIIFFRNIRLMFIELSLMASFE